MTIVRALNNYKFKKRFNDKSMLEFYEIAIEHYGGLDSCEDSLQTQYVWALNNVGQREKANQLANELFAANPSNPDIDFLFLVDYAERKVVRTFRINKSSNRSTQVTYM